MKYDVLIAASVPLQADNRRSVSLRIGDTLETKDFPEITKDKIKDLVAAGVLKKAAQSGQDLPTDEE